MISKSTIDRVYETSRLEEVIGDFVQLKKSGSSFKGLSPFSEERTPSFMVSPVKQIWKDFSTGKGGNVVAFLMEHEHFTYPEAIKYLAKKYNIEIEETEQSNEQKQAQGLRESLYLVSEYASTYFQETMHNTNPGKAIALSYFKERGFTPETIKKFDLGYCLDDWTAFTDTALKKGYKLNFLEGTGLTIVKGEKQFDRFTGRVMFPIQSMSGRVLGFGGRILTNDKKAAKYLNSPESEIYYKSKVLYGIYHAKQTIAKEDNCYIVEGYTDVIQFHQTGITNTVSSSGTALTPDQIRLINRLTKNITVLFDGDAAGLRASLRGIDLILEQGMNVKVCTFPEGEDPDSFAKANTESELREYLDSHSQDFIQFKASLLFEDSKNDPIKKAETIRDIVNSISKIPDNIKTEIYVKECARIMDVSEGVLFSTLAQIQSKGEEKAKPNKSFSSQEPPPEAFQVYKNEPQPAKVNVQFVLERKIISLLLLYGNRVEDFEDLVLKEDEESGELVLEPIIQKARVFEKIFLDLQEDEMAFGNNLFKDLYYTIIEALNQDPEFKIAQLTNTVPPELAMEMSSILMDDERYELSDWKRKDIHPKEKTDTVAQLVSETILTLRWFLIEQKVTLLSEQTLTDSENNHREILEEVMDYTKLKTLLSKKLKRPI